MSLAETRALTPIDLSQNELYSSDSWREPFAELRRTAPVSYCPESPYGAYWSVVTHDLIQQVELDHTVYSNSPDITLVDGGGADAFPTFLNMDPPRHTEIRRVFAEAFTPTQMNERTPEIRERTRALLDSLPLGETIDWVSDVSVPLTIGMLAILLDFPWDERYDLKKWSDMATEFSPDRMTEERHNEFMAEMAQMMMRFHALLEPRRAAPMANDLLSRMVHNEVTAAFNPMELMANIVLVVVAGNDTTRNSMSGLIEGLNRYPDQLDVLRADRSLIANVAQEAIRYQSPVIHMRRTATADAELGGQQIRKGDKVVLWYLSANRDESVFPDAERFDVARDNARRHLAFGHGIHRCVGARLAEVQLAILIEEILDRNIRVVQTGTPERQPSAFLRTFNAMPVRIERIG